MIGSGEEQATGEERVVAAGVATFMLALAVAAATHASATFRPIPAFLPIVVTLACAASALTAVLLAAQARVARSRPRLVLAAGFAFSACALVPQLLFSPFVTGERGPAGAGAQSAAWFWVWWHGGFALFAIAYAVAAVIAARDSSAPRVAWAHLAGAFAGAVALTTTLAFLTPACELWWPAPLVADGYDAFAGRAVVPAVLAVVALALAILALATRLRTVTQVWLAVALSALLLDCGLTLLGGAQATAGWYAARLESTFASSLVLYAVLRSIAALFERQAHSANVDGLTGLANRRAFDERLVLGASTALRTNGSLSLLMVDVDHLRRYNERYGHLAGDESLRAVARAIADSLDRKTDFAARFGGDEFAIVLPAMGAAAAERVALRIRDAVRRSAIPHAGSPAGFLTVSVGVSTLVAREGRGTRSAATLVTSADRALVHAKQSGRDRVAPADIPLPLTLPDGREVATGSG